MVLVFDDLARTTMTVAGGGWPSTWLAKESSALLGMLRRGRLRRRALRTPPCDGNPRCLRKNSAPVVVPRSLSDFGGPGCKSFCAVHHPSVLDP